MSQACKIICGLVILLSIFVPTAQTSAQSQSGNISVGGTVPGPPPATPPTIDQPLPNRVFTEKQITVEGTCIEGLIVKIFRNNVFGGSALCQTDATYTLTIDLFEDKNDLVARQYDLLEQASPDSSVVTVFYNPPQNISTENPEQSTAKFRLVIDYNYNFQGVFVGEPFHLPIHFIGGTGPYAVSVTWGDGNSDVFSREDTAQFHADHTYESAGAKTVEIRISDASGDEAYLQFVLIVSGGVSNPESAAGDESGGNGSKVTISWPTAIGTAVAIAGASFAGGLGVALFWDKLASIWQNIRLKIRGPKV